MIMELIGKRVVFKSPLDQIKNYNGEHGVVVDKFEADEHAPEAGFLYSVKLDNHSIIKDFEGRVYKDGGLLHVWPEEITEEA